jgi:hypothetical protein
MLCDYCGKELQENETCACQLPAEKARCSSFPLWMIPGVTCAVITLGYVALKLAGCNYFLWVHVIWSILAAVFFYLGMRNIKYKRRAFKKTGIILLTILILATAGKAYFFIEYVSYNNEHVYVSDIVDRYFFTEPVHVGALVYKYQNFVWYGPLLGRWSEIFDYYVQLWK